MIATKPALVAVLSLLGAVNGYAQESVPTLKTPKNASEIKADLLILDAKVSQAQAEIQSSEEQLSDFAAILEQWRPLAENQGRLKAWMHTAEGRQHLRQTAAADGVSEWKSTSSAEAGSDVARRIEALLSETLKISAYLRGLADTLAGNEGRKQELQAALARSTQTFRGCSVPPIEGTVEELKSRQDELVGRLLASDSVQLDGTASAVRFQLQIRKLQTSLDLLESQNETGACRPNSADSSVVRMDSRI